MLERHPSLDLRLRVVLKVNAYVSMPLCETAMWIINTFNWKSCNSGRTERPYISMHVWSGIHPEIECYSIYKIVTYLSVSIAIANHRSVGLFTENRTQNEFEWMNEWQRWKKERHRHIVLAEIFYICIIFCIYVYSILKSICACLHKTKPEKQAKQKRIEHQQNKYRSDGAKRQQQQQKQ